MKIVMVAGGSGGHIYPALTLARECIDKGHDVFFIGANDRMEKEVIPTSGFRFIGLDMKTTRGGFLQKVKSALSLVSSYFKAKKILKEDDVDIVIGFGNYISVPVLLAARALKIKTVIHEQNSYVGRANRFLDEKVDLVIGSYEENLKQFKNKNLTIIGNPQSSVAIKAPKDEEYLKTFDLDPNKKTLVIFMGSLGSESVMKQILDYFKLTDGSYQILYATGTKHYDRAKEYGNDYIKVVERIDGIKAMKTSTLLLSRAGATTLAEITAIGMPSILIPSPYVPNNHQFYNAKALVDKGAALMIEEKDLSAKVLLEKIDMCMKDDALRQELAFNALKEANTNVVEDIISRLENL